MGTAGQAPPSMTGSGNGVVDTPAGRVEAEARSVNHRFLKTSAHVGGMLAALEPAIEEKVRARCERGHVTVSVRFTRSSQAAAAAFQIDDDVAKDAAKWLLRAGEGLRPAGGQRHAEGPPRGARRPRRRGP